MWNNLIPTNILRYFQNLFVFTYSLLQKKKNKNILSNTHLRDEFENFIYLITCISFIDIHIQLLFIITDDQNFNFNHAFISEPEKATVSRTASQHFTSSQTTATPITRSSSKLRNKKFNLERFMRLSQRPVGYRTSPTLRHRTPLHSEPVNSGMLSINTKSTVKKAIWFL